MEDEKIERWISLPKRRQIKGVKTRHISATLPDWVIKLLDEEAKEKNKTRSQVITYLIYSGLKAHAGTFLYPNDNSINRNYLKRGKTWIIR